MFMSLISNKPKLCFLVDIDNTITKPAPPFFTAAHPLFGNNFVLLTLHREMVRHGYAPNQAENLLHRHTWNVLRWDYSEIIHKYGLPWQETLAAVHEAHHTMLDVYEDTVTLLRELHRHGFNLNIISNNPWWGCRWKIERAGLDPGIFNQIFSTDIMGGCKSNPEVWEFALPRLGVPMADVITIGDDLKEDCLIPQAKGVGRSFVLKRGKDITPPGEKIFCIDDARNIINEVLTCVN